MLDAIRLLCMEYDMDNHSFKPPLDVLSSCHHKGIEIDETDRKLVPVISCHTQNG